MMGIDEAGRGPVLGPLVYGTVFCKKGFDVKQVFKVKDSKQLKANARSNIYKQMEQATQDISYFVRVVTADEISQKMLRRQKYNINQMSYDCAISLINQVLTELQRRTDEDQSDTIHVLKEVYVDTVGKENKYQALLEETFPNIDTITVAAKADDLYPVVSAASIIAKVTRDALVEQSSDEKIGSGYPGDKVTRAWLDKGSDPVFGFHADMVRFSWSTISKLLKDDKFADVEWSDDEDEEMLDQQSLFSFAANNKRSTSSRDDFFNSRGLQLTSTL
jgi:ribonuclease H2 subunit A